MELTSGSLGLGDAGRWEWFALIVLFLSGSSICLALARWKVDGYQRDSYALRGAVAFYFVFLVILALEGKLFSEWVVLPNVLLGSVILWDALTIGMAARSYPAAYASMLYGSARVALWPSFALMLASVTIALCSFGAPSGDSVASKLTFLLPFAAALASVVSAKRRACSRLNQDHVMAREMMHCEFEERKRLKLAEISAAHSDAIAEDITRGHRSRLAQQRSAEEQARKVLEERVSRIVDQMRVNAALEKKEEEALREGRALDSARKTPAEDLRKREMLVMESLYRAGTAQTVAQISADAGLAPKLILRSCYDLQKASIVELQTIQAPGSNREVLDLAHQDRGVRQRPHWKSRKIWLTRKGHQDAQRESESRGPTVNIKKFDQRTKMTGDVHGPAIVGPNGRQRNSGQFGVGFDELSTAFVQALETMKGSLSSEQAQAFEQQMSDFNTTVEVPARKRIVDRIVAMASVVGNVGAPVISAGRKLLEALE